MAAEGTWSLPDVAIGMVAGASARGVEHGQDGGVGGCVFLDYGGETTGLVGHLDDGQVSRRVTEIR